MSQPVISDLLGLEFVNAYRFRDLEQEDLYRVAHRTWHQLGKEAYTSQWYYMEESMSGWEGPERDMYAVISFVEYSYDYVEISEGTLNTWMPDNQNLDVPAYLSQAARDGH